MKFVWISSPAVVLFLLVAYPNNVVGNNAKNTVTDIDGNVYHTIKIGNQVWMKENLRTTRYNDGSPIPLVTDSLTWGKLTTPGYCWYNNDSATFGRTYGALYNWHAVNTKKLAPKGWHVPSDSEWTILTKFLGGEDVAGGQLKDTGTTYWNSPNTGATNAKGFSAHPGGYRGYHGGFGGIGNGGDWWSATTTSDTALSCHRIMFNFDARANRDVCDSFYGLSVRCVKN